MNFVVQEIFDLLLKLQLLLLPLVFFPLSHDPFRPFKELLFHVIMLGIVVAWGCRLLLSEDDRLFFRRIISEGKPRLLIGLFLLSVVGFWFSFILGERSVGSLNNVVNYTLGAVLFLAFLDAFWRCDIAKWIWLLAVASLINAVYGVVQYVGFDPLFFSLDPEFHEKFRRYLVAGFMDSPNMLTPLLVSVLPYIFCRWVTAGSRASFFTATVIGVVIILPVLFSRNLAAIGALGAVMVVLLIYFSIRALRHAKGTLLKVVICWVIVVATAIGGTLFIKGMDEEQWLMKKWSIDQRQTQNLSAWKMFRESPLTGKGPGYFYSHFVEYRRAVWFSNPPDALPGQTAHQVHNDYLQFLAEGGLIAAVPAAFALLLMLSYHAGFMRKVLNRPVLSNGDLQMIGASGGFWVIAVNAFGNFPFHIAPLAVTAIFLAALAQWRIMQSENEEV